jgi:putative aldouronate transport system permease protein
VNNNKVAPVTIANSHGAMKVLYSMKRYWQIYVLVLPALAWYIIFAYYPMAGLQLAFKTYMAKLGIWGSPWNGLNNFSGVFRDSYFWAAIIRTLVINLGRLVFTFPFPIILALAFNELRMGRYKRVMQTVYTFPNFLSWVIVASIMQNLLSVDGLVNGIITACGGSAINFLGSEQMFVPMLYVTDIWKSAGYSSIIYLSAISGIDQDQYEAAEVDGANRWQRLIHITLPCILPTISIMFILTCGNLMTNGFDQIFNISNAATKNVAEILDMYIYRITFQGSTDFGFSTAVSLFRSVINMAMLLVANFTSKKLTGNGLLM